MARRIAASVLAVALIGAATAGSSSQTVKGAMTSLRQAHATDGIGGSGAGSGPLFSADGLLVKTSPPLPTLLLGVRDASGFKAYADAAEGVELSPASTAMIGSQTKTFTAAAILQLDQEGRLSIGDTLADPRWAGVLRWPNGEAITIEMVLSHTAGIPEFSATQQFQQGMSDPSWAPSPEDMLAFARGAKPSFAPGEGWRYSNTDYIILGVIIEQATGNSYESELRSRFFEPLGLTDTRLYGASSAGPTMPGFILWCADQAEPGTAADGQAEAAAAKPAEKSDTPPREATSGPQPCPSGAGEWRPIAAPSDHIWPLIWAAGGIVSSTADMTKWITHLIATDDVLDAEHRRLMQTPVRQSKDGIAKELPSLAGSVTGYGLGLFVFNYDIGTGYGHSGNAPGYASNSVYFPGQGNDFAMTILAGETEADVVADGGNAIALAVKATRR